MIKFQTLVKIADNSGAKTAKCIKILGGTHNQTATVGDIIVVAIKSAVPGGKVKKGEVKRALVVRTRKPILRKNGMLVSFSENAVVLINLQNKLIGTRVLGPVTTELRKKKFMRLVSLSTTVI